MTFIAIGAWHEACCVCVDYAVEPEPRWRCMLRDGGDISGEVVRAGKWDATMDGLIDHDLESLRL